MTTPTDGGPAFPAPADWKTDPGMSLRDYFAAKAISVIHDDYAKNMDNDERTGVYDAAWFDAVAIDAYRLADAMLKARQS